MTTPEKSPNAAAIMKRQGKIKARAAATAARKERKPQLMQKGRAARRAGMAPKRKVV